eukprot:4295850-Pyramimonas_sp.AAC.1
MMLSELFVNISGDVNFETTGHALDVSALGDATTYATIVARLARAIGDEEALRELHMNKGRAGSKPCAICRNVLKKKFGYTQFDSPWTYVDVTCLDKSKLADNTDATVVAILERLRPDWE